MSAFGKSNQLTAPFPYFGGKSRVVDAVWSRLGDPYNYIEPFCGSAAVLLGRPSSSIVGRRIRKETVNDFDGLLVNFWRAVTADPEQVAHYANWPVSEIDLVARNKALVEAKSRLAQQWDDPNDYDAKLAGWWVWASNLWIGAGIGQSVVRAKLPDMQGRGTASGRVTRIASARHMIEGVEDLPVEGQINLATEASIRQYLVRLQARLRSVRICCGDWKRVLSSAITTQQGVTGVFLDPPYQMNLATKRSKTYDHDSGTIFDEVWDWCLSCGDDPIWRIGLCGYDDGRPTPQGWEKYRWSTSGGYGNQNRKGRGIANGKLETIWFSPHCDGMLGELFGGSESDLLDIETEEHDATNT